MAKAKKEKQAPIVYTAEQLAWVDPCENIFAEGGKVRCRTCGSGIRVGGSVERDGVSKKRVYTPWKWWNEHRHCGDKSNGS